MKYIRRNFLCGLQGREPSGLAISTHSCGSGYGKWPTSECTEPRTRAVSARWNVDQLQLAVAGRTAALSLRG